MPPRKRKTSVSTFVSQSNRRITRSSTKTDSPATTTPTVPTKSESKPSKTRKVDTKAESKSKTKTTTDAPSSTSTSSASKTKSTAKTPDAPTDASSSPHFETLSITSDLVKNPIQSHSYPSSSTTTIPTLIFTHGAGGSLSAPAVVNFCTGFSSSLPILAFQGSMNLGSRVKAFHACIQHIGNEQKKLVLGGRSMGSRAAVMAASEVIEEGEGREVDLVLVSYPLQGPKDVRDQILLDLPKSVKVMFVIGDRDSMCPLDLLDDVRKKMKANSQVVVVRGGDHGMHTKPAKLEKEVGEETGRLAAKWLAGEVSDEVKYIGEEG